MEREAPEQAINAPRVLVVEDDPFIRTVIADALRAESVTVIEAANGDEAWRFLQADRNVDLIFSDHNMPGSLPGAQLLQLVETNFPHIATVLTSGDFDGKGYHGRVVRKPYSVLAMASELAREARSRQQKGDS